MDSRSATAGMQILVNYACKLRDSGLPAQDIAAQLEQLRGKIRIFAMVDTLEYLRRGGRLSALQGAVGCRITASGGVSGNGDIRRLRDMGLYGAIVGKAYYAGTIDLALAIREGARQ